MARGLVEHIGRGGFDGIPLVGIAIPIAWHTPWLGVVAITVWKWSAAFYAQARMDSTGYVGIVLFPAGVSFSKPPRPVGRKLRVIRYESPHPESVTPNFSRLGFSDSQLCAISPTSVRNAPSTC